MSAIRLTAAQAAKLGIAATYSDTLLERVIKDLEKRNLRDQKDHETRFLAQRASALRHERRTRKALGTYQPA